MTFTIASSFNNELFSFDTRSSRADVIKSVDTPIVNLTKSIDSLFLFSYTTNSELITIDLRNTSEALKIIDISSENVNYFASSKKGIYNVSSSITFYPSNEEESVY